MSPSIWGTGVRSPMHHLVSIFPVRSGGQILLQLRDDRPDLVNPNLWGTLGGSVEAGETPEEAAWRELEEEVGRRPTQLAPAGFVDRPSPRNPEEVVRIHLFGAPVTWRLEDLILGEGQGVDWFAQRTVSSLRVAPVLAPVIPWFLASSVYRDLVSTSEPTPPDSEDSLEPLEPGLIESLGLALSDLLAVHGAPACFVRALWDLFDGTGIRVTASPGATEHPAVLLWWPHGEDPASFLLEWRIRLLSDGVIWVVRNPGLTRTSPGGDSIRPIASALGFIEDGLLSLGQGNFASRFVSATGTRYSFAWPWTPTDRPREGPA